MNFQLSEAWMLSSQYTGTYETLVAVYACFSQNPAPQKLAEFLAGMTKLNLSDKRLSYGTEYGRSVAVRRLESYQQLSRYKYELRRLKGQADHIKSEKLARAWCNSCNNDFWNLVRQSHGNSKFSGCNIIDGLTTDEDISNMLSSKISSLLNSELDQSARNTFLADLTDSISNSDLQSSEISSTVVLNALAKHKKGKLDGSSLFSDAFIFAKDILSNLLSQLFTAVVRHGYVPKLLRDCILQLIPKPGKDPTCSDNYRPIALAPN